jgi:hypothetical protein
MLTQPNMIKSPPLFLEVSPKVENEGRGRLFKCMRLNSQKERM